MTESASRSARRGPRTRRSQLFDDLRLLASEQMEGRRSGTHGASRALRFIRESFATIGLSPLFPGFEQPFVFRDIEHQTAQGFNAVGLLRGAIEPDAYIVVSAHYDHLGRTESEGTFNGADDNASGVATMLYVARAFAAKPPRCTIVFAAFDGEEAGLKGSAAFVDRAPLPLDRIAVCVNVDMVGRAPDGILWVAGTRQHPELKRFVERAASRSSVPVRYGHDRPSLKRGDNWTHESDQGSFADRGIPWILFSTSNDEITHAPEDTAAAIQWPFFASSARIVLDTVRALDARGMVGATSGARSRGGM